MKPVCLDIPDDTTQLAAWLERHLVGMHLADLAAELTAVHGQTPGPALDQILGPRGDSILTQGLSVLQPMALRSLLRHPDRLLELQERILVEGGAYWDRLADRDEELADLDRRVATRVLVNVGNGAVSPSSRQRPSWTAPWVVSLATAAAVLLAVFVARPFLSRTPVVDHTGTAVATTWGWSSPFAGPAPANASEYLVRRADQAQEWFNKRPEDRLGVATRINEFRQGCSTLIVSEHPLLAAADQKWLVEKCRAWAEKFDEQLRALESGTDPMKVRDSMDTVTNKLIDALKNQAKVAKAV